ncbi:MAG: ABC transporter ATP-binding protein [Ruminococcaceae bacterium]|nr:ABC transporter ATP-binding protein [Oscillospiraceae bacterium]
MTMQSPQRKKRGFLTVLSYDARIIAKVWILVPWFIICLAINAVVWAFIDSIAVYFRNAMFNALDAGGAFWDVARYILALAIFYTLVFIPHHLYHQVINPILDNKLRHKIHEELYIKAQSMDIACYDDPDFYNQFVWAMNESDNRAIAVVGQVSAVLHRLAATSAITVILLNINVFVGILMFCGVLATMVVDVFGNRLWVKQSEECNPLWRKGDYYTRTFYLSDYAKEMRSGDVADMMAEHFEENVEILTETEMRYGKKFAFLYGVLWQLFRRGTYYGTVLIMVYELMTGGVQLGGFAAAVSAVWMLQYSMSVLGDNLMELPKHALYIEKYFAFLEHKNTLVSGEAEVPPFESLTLENVSFSYVPMSTEEEMSLSEAVKAFERKQKGEKTEKEKDTPQKDEPVQVLKNINMTIHRGEKTAIVGYNGAGKTTLIKLMMRLYDPTEGRILYNGRDIREFCLSEYREKIGAVFQDYRLFCATLAENVVGGCYTHSEAADANVLEALKNATFGERLDTLPKGLDTALSKDLDKEGVNLSGGEAQKVAIARVFVRPYELIIMDEPSSALDPMAEYQLNHSILHAADDEERTVIFISHRLSTTRFADKIYLFADGELCETGSHVALMAQNGKYAEMFNMQAEKYRKGEENQTSA